MSRIFLDTWVRDLNANTEYRLQRAVDTLLDGTCSSESWLTLGRGLTPQTLLTNDVGTGREEFYRDLPANLTRQTFDWPIEGRRPNYRFQCLKINQVSSLRTYFFSKCAPTASAR